MRLQFWNDEDGAVTVDWTVLTAATVGLGIATYGVVSGGINDLSGDVGTQMRGTKLYTSFNQVLSADFENGMDGFAGGVVRDLNGFGNILTIDGTHGRGVEATSKTFDLQGDRDYAVVEFDMAFLDSWDNETGTVYLNGEAVAIGQFTHRNHSIYGNANLPPQMQALGVVGVEVDFQGQTNDIQGGAHVGYPDHTQKVRIVMDNPGDALTVGFGTNLSSSGNDESLGIDNLTVTSTDQI